MTLKVNNKEFNELITKFQEGGQMAPAENPNATPEAAPQETEDPQAQLLAACQQALDTQDCNMAMQVCAAVFQIIGGAAPAAPAAPQGQAPVYRKGGRLSRWVNK